MFKATHSVLRFGPRAFNVPIASPAKPLYASRSRLPSLRPQFPLQVARFASKSDDPPPPRQPIDREAELKTAHKKLEPRPAEVSSDSSTTRGWDSTVPVMTSPGTAGEGSINSDLKHDINIVKDTFSLKTVPKEANALGLAGTIPYMATSLSTIFLAWDLGKELPTGNMLYDAVFINHDTAKWLLDLLQPIQLGYGAVIISFLGAIHWGLEFAEKQPLRERTRFRYGMGLASSIVAWPTLFMPFEYALTVQWAAFVALYFGDARATRIGWAPRWYGVYRFLLTAIVGFSILVSLVGRASMSQHGRLSSEGISSSLSTPGLADTHTNWAELEKQEKEKIKKEKEEAEKKAKKEAAEKKKQEKKNKAQGKDNAKGGEQAAEGKNKSDDKKGDDADKQDKSKEGEDKQADQGKEKSEDEGEDKSNDKDNNSEETKDKDESENENQSEDKKSDKDKNEGEETKDKDDSKNDQTEDKEGDKDAQEKISDKKGKK